VLNGESEPAISDYTVAADIRKDLTEMKVFLNQLLEKL
jgi:hypothetical protein